ncbi:MAG: xanthine dehydrogenase family protein molybdopterin-binding subunit [Alphaproteobacteria bacterium]|nr:xanthine dehydrogenase family protein molybdopterin-binding subunit [Alphaproteobacteria bacterium]
MPKTIGQPLKRKEDARLLTGNGRYSDDVNLPGQAYAAIVRSPHAHARIVKIGTSAARGMPGVLAVLTGSELMADGIKDIPHTPIPAKPPADILLINRDGSPHGYAPQTLLAVDRARYVGQQVAMVVAETFAQAKDAAERVTVEYEVLPPLVAGLDSVAPSAPKLYDHVANVCVDADVGDVEATKAAFARAARVARIETQVQRVTGVPLDARAAIGVYDPATGKHTLHAGSGGVVRQKAELAGVLGVPVKDVRVECGDVGGNYGTRNGFYPEFGLVVWAAKRLGRPVKWTCDRTEAFASDYQGRDQRIVLELALDERGRFLAARGEVIQNAGAHSVMYVPLMKCSELLTSVYRVPTAHIRSRAALTTTVPTSPYRSAGRPEAMFAIERVIDIAARQFGYDRIDLRRRNLIPPSAQPYPNPLGMTYDSGDYAAAMDRVLAMSDWKGFNKRKRESRKNGRLRGIGLANYIESTSGAPREYAKVDVQPEGRVEVTVGTLSSGQGHETSFAQCIAQWLGVGVESVRLIQGDTDIVPAGGGSHSARSMRMGGVVMGKASDAVILKATRIAGHVMEADAADIAFAEGRFTVKGTDRSIGLFDVAKAARERNDLPEDLRGPLAADCDELILLPAFPFGSHVCEVEIDPDTGKTEIVRYTAVDDVGTAVNPLILHGQTHGAIVQGVGQALWEHSHYDPESGQLLAGSFMDYAMPRAPMLPSFATEISETPAPGNKLGVRGGGEGGTTPALAVVVNAIVDALSDYGVTHMEMPVTAEKVWRAIRAGKAKAA